MNDWAISSSIVDFLPTIGLNSATTITENKPAKNQSNSTKKSTDEYEVEDKN